MGDQKKLLLRINKGLWEKINQWAEEDFRSVNSQIEFLLKEAVKKKYPRFEAGGQLPEKSSEKSDGDDLR